MSKHSLAPHDECETIDERSSGLKRLLAASSPKAFYNSSARHPPPRCYPGTRSTQRQYIAQWPPGSSKQLLWFNGSPGIGKSAIAQTCAEELGATLGAAFFFSKPNNTDEPLRLFPSIAYQLSLIIASYGDTLDQRIRSDPTVLTKSLSQQFREIISLPSQELMDGHHPRLVIIIDGLDECRSPAAQTEIVEIIASSVRSATNPFLWVVFSRPESHLVDAFNSSLVAPICHVTDVPPACDEVERFIVDKLRSIGQHVFDSPLLSAWPHDATISVLIRLSRGLFLLAATILAFLDISRSDGLDSRLRTILEMDQPEKLVCCDNDSCISSLDRLYTLILNQFPADTRSISREILFATTLPGISTNAYAIANLLHLSESQFRESVRDLHPVVTVAPTYTGPEISFRHISFFDFLFDPQRSLSFNWQQTCVLTLRDKLLQRLKVLQELHNPTHASVDSHLITWRRGGRDYYDQYRAQQNCVGTFFHLCQLAPLDGPMLTSLTQLDFSNLCLFWNRLEVRVNMISLLHAIPAQFQDMIIRPFAENASTLDEMDKPPHADSDFSFIIGNGSRKAICWGKEGSDHISIVAYPKHRIWDHVKYHGSRHVKAISSFVRAGE